MAKRPKNSEPEEDDEPLSDDTVKGIIGDYGDEEVEPSDVEPAVLEDPPAPPEMSRDDKMMAMMERQEKLLALAFTMLEQRGAAPDSERREEMVASAMAQLATAMSEVSRSQREGAKLIADETRRAARPSNEVVPEISVFNRQGRYANKKPPFKCPMMVPWLLEWESCTREEVELANLLQPGEYVIKRVDNSKFLVTVTVDYKLDRVSPSRLLMTNSTAYTNDSHRMLPALVEQFRQVLRQHPAAVKAKAANIMSDEQEEALIEAGEIIPVLDPKSVHESGVGA